MLDDAFVEFFGAFEGFVFWVARYYHLIFSMFMRSMYQRFYQLGGEVASGGFQPRSIAADLLHFEVLTLWSYT